MVRCLLVYFLSDKEMRHPVRAGIFAMLRRFRIACLAKAESLGESG